MDPHSVFLAIMVCVNILVFVLVMLTLFEFSRLDKDQFRYYMIGLLFYGITVLFFFLRYVLLPPVSKAERVIFGTGVSVLPLFGMFYFIKGTEYLAKQENSDFRINEKLHNLVLYVIIAIALYETIYIPIIVYRGINSIVLSVVSYLCYVVVIVLALKLLTDYTKILNPIVRNIIYEYIIAVILLIGGGILLLITLRPIRGDTTFTDLSYARNSFAIISALIILIPFIICQRSVSTFRKALMK